MKALSRHEQLSMVWEIPRTVRGRKWRTIAEWTKLIRTRIVQVLSRMRIHRTSSPYHRTRSSRATRDRYPILHKKRCSNDLVTEELDAKMVNMNRKKLHKRTRTRVVSASMAHYSWFTAKASGAPIPSSPIKSGLHTSHK